jgi:hypothetical protein
MTETTDNTDVRITKAGITYPDGFDHDVFELVGGNPEGWYKAVATNREALEQLRDHAARAIEVHFGSAT